MLVLLNQEKNLVSLHYSRSNRFLYDNGVKINSKLKAKGSEVKYPVCLNNISKVFAVNNMKNKTKQNKNNKNTRTGLNGFVYNFSVDCNTIDVRNI